MSNLNCYVKVVIGKKVGKINWQKTVIFCCPPTPVIKKILKPDQSSIWHPQIIWLLEKVLTFFKPFFICKKNIFSPQNRIEIFLKTYCGSYGHPKIYYKRWFVYVWKCRRSSVRVFVFKKMVIFTILNQGQPGNFCKTQWHPK